MARTDNISKATPTQNFVPVKEIRDGVAVLKDNSLCAILMSSSLNFALKSGDEQTGTLMQFQNFLNSLDFPIQIVIQSRKADIRPYIMSLEERLKVQTNELLRVQNYEYIKFVQSFVEQVDIMKKSFYVVIPYNPALVDSTSVSSLIAGKKADSSLTIERFEEFRSQLQQRVSVVEQGLGRCGIRSLPLGTEELIELFYHTMNPSDITSSAPVTS
jgi:type IV secretory pathway VirB4 component